MKQLICLAVLSFPLFAQSTKVTPDCTLGASFTTTGSSSDYDNRSGNSANSGPPCTLWALTWSAQSAVTSLTINIEGAPDSNGTPGSFASLTSAATFPSGKVTYDMTGAGSYSPWMRITVSAVGAGGAINAVLNGWREDPASIGGGGGSSTTTNNCDPSTSTLAVTTATITLSSSGLTQIVAASSGHKILVCSMGVSFQSGVNFQLETGTGSNCGTGTAALTGTLAYITGLALDSTASILTPVSVAVCVNLGSSVTGGGWVTYAVD